MSALQQILEGRICVACGCSDAAPCMGQNTPTRTCFWTWTDGEFGLCSACAALPFDQLVDRIRAQNLAMPASDLGSEGPQITLRRVPR